MDLLDLKESIDFNFFDELPESPRENVTPNSLNISALKPPVHPSSAKPLPKTEIVVNSSDNKFSGHARRLMPSSESDSRDSSPEYLSVSSSKSEKKNKSLSSHKNADVGSQRSSSSSSSSARSSFGSNSSLPDKSNSYYDNHLKSKNSDAEKANRPHSSSGSDSEGRPTNPVANSKKQAFHKRYQQKKAEHNLSEYSDSSIRKTKTSATLCDDNGDSNWASKGIDRRHGWEDVNETKEQEKRSKSVKPSGTFRKDRPKTAVKKRTKIMCTDRPLRSHSASGTLSDSDITDVSSIDTPRNSAQEKYDKRDNSKMTSAGDGHPVKIRFKSVSNVGQEDDTTDQDYDPDKITGLDLKILMKAVGELEKQKRVQSSSRRVMFDPPTLRSIEKGNYTFDKTQTRDIERENHRLLKEIVRQVNSQEQKKQFYRSSNFYRLTPSAVNRERDIQRIERENLAFLRRLQEVKPTKSICRDQQLRSYESTVYHGVPIAALHQKPKGRHLHNHAIDDSDISIEGRTRSVTSVTSIGSSVRSVGSSRSSRPNSASRKSCSSSKHFNSRPTWSDRW